MRQWGKEEQCLLSRIMGFILGAAIYVLQCALVPESLLEKVSVSRAARDHANVIIFAGDAGFQFGMSKERGVIACEAFPAAAPFPPAMKKLYRTVIRNIKRA